MRFARLLAIFTCLIATAVCSPPAGAEQKIIKLATTLPENHPIGQGSLRFKQLVEQRTGGSVTVQIFPNNQLGGENAILQQTKQGSIQMALTAAGTLGNLVPEISVLDAPYLWKDFATEKKVLSGPIFARFQREFTDKQGLRLMSATWYYGKRQLNTNKPVRKPEDAAGMKIRTPPSPVNLLAGRVLGGNPTPMDFPQVYLALKTGTIDAEENPLATIISSKMYEVAKVIIMTGHIQQSQVLSMNQAFWASLSRDEQRAVQSAANDAGDYESGLALKAEEDDVKRLQAIPGVTVITDPDLAAFRARAKTMAGEMRPKWGDLYDRLLALQ